MLILDYDNPNYAGTELYSTVTFYKYSKAEILSNLTRHSFTL